MLESTKIKSNQLAKKSEKTAWVAVRTTWRLALDLLWIGVTVILVSLFIWALTKAGLGANQPILQSIAGWVDNQLSVLITIFN